MSMEMVEGEVSSEGDSEFELPLKSDATVVPEEEPPKEVVKVEETAVAPEASVPPAAPKPVETEVGVKRSAEDMEGNSKEAMPMPSPARPRLNINKSDKGQIGSHRSRDSKENRCKYILKKASSHAAYMQHSIRSSPPAHSYLLTNSALPVYMSFNH